MKRVTIKDLARQLNLNPSTVSRALKDHPDISVETKNKVKELAELLQYRPNNFAINFRNRKSNTIGLIVPQFSMIYFPSLLKGINEILRPVNYNLLVLPSNESLQGEKNSLEICERNGIDGLLASVSRETLSGEHFQSLIDYNVPVVFLDRIPFDKGDVSQVIVDDKKAAERATISLLEAGVKKIIGFFGNENLQISQNRRLGFYQQCEKFNLSPNNMQAHHCSNRFEVKDILLKFIETRGIPEGIFTMSDETLIGVMQAIHQLNIKVPEQVSIVAISDGEFPEFYNPKTTYVETSGYKVGKAAAELLVNLINNDNRLNQQIIIDTPLIEGYSIKN